ncbi:MAG: hypothetical protein A2233_04960 [Candidatus Kerfeldbacteria bacterium RIFOXYA2_FULL_38_24]|uniref:AbiEi antitoxin C-terminal domain-containing protein n=1 Tax=Candidatus Kerfeldbacteria bacterium RIFOXYB2_FULL_38_14 TaxID=1798547 RepID=A0A1G2B9J2_9BACT|nr:MAG: hypothetical protein A2233_04960 [Candidatus Kerfeldbacteria bacterium RIFOXYA2_FULL_38_24]OGY85675.1 MAG: hypothetical protein A2319_05230 [Candidatus Kerfeldbacteria bacterium RIFOXYB2_FULL_38_14]OGY88361.1 MAG: hypothetical protein A2458_02765 [Candidatus Kerfeldbacteria bacterium RIFOXYC2_FULL_38_9]
MDNPLILLERSKKTVFTTKELAIFWGEQNIQTLKSKINYYVKRGKIINLRKGLYAKNEHYNQHELAVSIFVPSYISFETILQKNGINFQYYETIFIASIRSATTTIHNQLFQFRKLKKDVLYNTNGLVHKETYTEASTERAVLDLLYLNKLEHLDNPRGVNWNKCEELAPLYNNQQLIKRLKILRKQFAE